MSVEKVAMDTICRKNTSEWLINTELRVCTKKICDLHMSTASTEKLPCCKFASPVRKIPTL